MVLCSSSTIPGGTVYTSIECSLYTDRCLNSSLLAGEFALESMFGGRNMMAGQEMVDLDNPYSFAWETQVVTVLLDSRGILSTLGF